MFNSRDLAERPGDVISEDRFRNVELAVSFRQLTCYRCGFAAVYKFRVQHLRRNTEIVTGEEEHVRTDHEAIWQAIPRFAEIPETVKCKRCREVLGIYTSCIY